MTRARRPHVAEFMSGETPEPSGPAHHDTMIRVAPHSADASHSSRPAKRGPPTCEREPLVSSRQAGPADLRARAPRSRPAKRGPPPCEHEPLFSSRQAGPADLRARATRLVPPSGARRLASASHSSRPAKRGPPRHPLRRAGAGELGRRRGGGHGSRAGARMPFAHATSNVFQDMSFSAYGRRARVMAGTRRPRGTRLRRPPARRPRSSGPASSLNASPPRVLAQRQPAPRPRSTPARPASSPNASPPRILAQRQPAPRPRPTPSPPQRVVSPTSGGT